MAFFDLTGKVAFITGTSRGLGQYFARALAQAGADIAMSSRDAAKLAPFRKEIEALGRRTCGVDLDVRDHASIKAAVAPLAQGADWFAKLYAGAPGVMKVILAPQV